MALLPPLPLTVRLRQVKRRGAICEEAAAKIERLEAALLVARECIDGHFDDACSDCRNAVATIDAALDRQTGARR